MNQSDEKLLREFVKKTFVKQILQEQKRQHQEEQQVRAWVRSLISEVQEEKVLQTLFEAKDTSNPHPNTGINKLRDAIRKAKPSIKSKYQQLTTSAEQRESFRNHFLGAMVRLFDELDALNAQGEQLDFDAEEFDPGPAAAEMEAPPTDVTSGEMADEIEDAIMETILKELGYDLNEEEVDVVSDEAEDTKEKSQIEKDFEKKSKTEKEREAFGSGIGGDTTGRNQAFDTFNLVQTYFSDAYLDLNNPEDQEMYKKWGLYNIELLLDKYEQELAQNPEAPNIEAPV